MKDARKIQAQDRPRFLADEVALGLSLALALHVVPLTYLVRSSFVDTHRDDDAPPVREPVISATLMKLGKPLDPTKLPDRVVPMERTVKHTDVTASQDAPDLQKRDAGAPKPDDGKDSDLDNLINKSDPFAEKPKNVKPELGAPNGSDAGAETDPSRVHAGDLYAASLEEFFRKRWEIPTVISPGEARRYCAIFRVRINPQMAIWNVRREAMRSSGSELFDDSVRSMLMKLLDTGAPLPSPPAELEATYRGSTVDLVLTGDPQGDAKKCTR